MRNPLPTSDHEGPWCSSVPLLFTAAVPRPSGQVVSRGERLAEMSAFPGGPTIPARSITVARLQTVPEVELFDCHLSATAFRRIGERCVRTSRLGKAMACMSGSSQANTGTPWHRPVR
ncbi:hypothetical protein SBA6_180014 [Candidatus Sulfopaludibacter sp. SbA6]|nr:hypothetical protein SBA6_180014 [Candidatus Sulfopaludibacter sp. SbA6]